MSTVRFLFFCLLGQCELTRLLVYSGFNPKQKDNFGQYPLHLAALSGDLMTVKLLCEQVSQESNRIYTVGVVLIWLHSQSEQICCFFRMVL